MYTTKPTEKSVKMEPFFQATKQFFEEGDQILSVLDSLENCKHTQDTTIQSWTHLLKRRDHETEEHGQRVSSMTVQLVRALGFSNEDLVHVRRGALLHDIGKTKVPDRILHKAGKLTDAEWDILRQHPYRAVEMLSESRMLKPALDIPQFHHERWDGSGYPFGLKGEQIPLTARATALIDVWDALVSDRPYRKAWPVEKTFNYIRNQSGAHFDPHVVDVFFQLI